MQRESDHFEDDISLSSGEYSQGGVSKDNVQSNQQQYNRMISFMKDQNDTMSMNKGLWFQLAVELNELGPPRLSTAEWRRHWFDYKAEKNKNESLVIQVPPTDKPIVSPPLTPQVKVPDSPASEPSRPPNTEKQVGTPPTPQVKVPDSTASEPSRPPNTEKQVGVQPTPPVKVPDSSASQPSRPPNTEKQVGVAENFETEILRRLDDLDLIMHQQLKVHEELLLNVKLLTTKFISTK
ncbi:hypothetical protein Bhyg_14327 [Pseudolycoriella hygida]|uniref:Regulatory protein zeste n=1 Tax=Pseudolycoriella hygida TaxID=35572 RepID=A0A9Q0RX64_9DIPT|nr:hypothetical protein Bhyg_14327 [Pseudolycoriella hygida]